MLPVESYVFSLLFAGHVVGDFVLQTEETAREKRRDPRVLAWHVGQHLLATTVILVWGWTRLSLAAPGAFPTVTELSVVLTAIAVTHFLVDRFKIFLDEHYGAKATFFVVDQVVHVAVLVTALAWLRQRHDEWSVGPQHPIFVLGQPVSIADYAGWILLLAAVILVARGGAILSWIVTRPLLHEDPSDIVAREPLRPSRELFLGYAERAGGILLLGTVSVWAPVVLFVALAVAWWRSARSRQLSVSAATVAVVGLGVWMASSG